MPRRLGREFIKRARLHGTPRLRAACRFDLAAVLEELGSTDDEVRARALEHLCPCRSPWEVYERHRDIIRSYIKDPSWLVRQTALQIEREVVEIEAVRAAWERAETYVTRERLKMRTRTGEGKRRG
jgi:hypothetical protein